MIYWGILFVFLLSANAALATAKPDDDVSNSKATRRVCTVQPGGSEAIDDAPAIIQAFEQCGYGGTVVFLNTTYYVNSVMNTTGLADSEVDLRGTLLVPMMLLSMHNNKNSANNIPSTSGERISHTGSPTPSPSATRISRRPGSSAAITSASMAMAMAR